MPTYAIQLFVSMHQCALVPLKLKNYITSDITDTMQY